MFVYLAVSLAMHSTGEHTEILSAIKEEGILPSDEAPKPPFLPIEVAFASDAGNKEECIQPSDEAPGHSITSAELAPDIKEECILPYDDRPGLSLVSIELTTEVKKECRVPSDKILEHPNLSTKLAPENEEHIHPSNGLREHSNLSMEVAPDIKDECLHPSNELPKHLISSLYRLREEHKYTISSLDRLREEHKYAISSLYRLREEHKYAAVLPNNSDVGNNSKFQSNNRKLNLLNKVYSCYMCKAKFYTFSALKSHKKVHKIHKVREPTVQGHKVQKQKVQEHKVKEYRCDTCDLVFTNKRRYWCHKDGHKFYKCELCDKIISRLQNLKQHIRMKHNMQPGKTYPQVKDSSLYYRQVKHGNREALLDRKCVICSQEFDTRQLLMAHMRTYNRTCPKCQKKFPRINNLKQHMLTHLNVDTSIDYKCKKCNIDHTDLDSLNHHMVLNHPNETMPNPQLFPCTLCKKVFPTEFHLKRHKYKHECRQSKRFICSICDKAFSRKSYYEDHKITHTNQRPYSCKICGATYRYSRGLRHHMHTHKDSGSSRCENGRPVESGWLCSKCGKIFSCMSNLRAHELSVHFHRKRKETRVCCEICGKLVNTKHLKAHIESHRKELNYSCNLCSKKFYTRSSLRYHMNLHNIPTAIRQARSRKIYQKRKQQMF